MKVNNWVKIKGRNMIGKVVKINHSTIDISHEYNLKQGLRPCVTRIHKNKVELIKDPTKKIIGVI